MHSNQAPCNSPRQSIALLDWDETLRRGITLFTWVEFLVKWNVFSPKQQALIESTRAQRVAGRLTYEQFAKQVSALYAVGLKGQMSRDINALGHRFVELDTHQVFPFVSSLLAVLKNCGITACVISGCPAVLLEHYTTKLQIESFHGLEIQEDKHGRYTGQIRNNPALVECKNSIATRLQTQYIVALAMGNTTSDIPLLRRARCAFVIDGNPSDFPADQQKRYRFVSPNLVLPLIQECLRDE